MATTRRTVTATLEGGPYVTRIAARGLEVLVDEPIEEGGGDRGLRPHELLLGALASCTAITMRMYAERKGWDVGPIGVEAVMDRDQQGAAVDTHIRLDITLRPELPADQRDRLLQIAHKCPVHRTLMNPMRIEAVLK